MREISEVPHPGPLPLPDDNAGFVRIDQNGWTLPLEASLKALPEKSRVRLVGAVLGCLNEPQRVDLICDALELITRAHIEELLEYMALTLPDARPLLRRLDDAIGASFVDPRVGPDA